MTDGFNDPALRRVFERVCGGLYEMRQKLDKASSDIKELERVLDETAVKTVVTVPITDCEMISWQKGTPDRWRLCYQDISHYPHARSGILIEQPADVRLRAWPFLAKLLAEVTTAVGA